MPEKFITEAVLALTNAAALLQLIIPIGGLKIRGVGGVMPAIYDQIRTIAILRISQTKPLHKKKIKRVVDEIKKQYVVAGVPLSILDRVSKILKADWRVLKVQAKSLER